MEKDYTFYPTETESPKFLSSAQIEYFNRHGFISPLPGFSGEEIHKQRQYFDKLLQQLSDTPEKGDVHFGGEDKRDSIQYSLNCFHTKLRGIWETMYAEPLLRGVRDLIGDDVVAWATHYFCKLPGDGKAVSFHQDASYWGLTPAKTVTVWLALDDTDDENGAMQFLPGSHKVGHIPWKESSEESVLNQQIEDISVFEKPFSNNLKAGEFSLHSSLLVHGSPKNQSSRRRCGLTIRYAPQDVVPLSPNYSKMSYFVSGNITAPHWQDNEPPSEYFL
jgi:non-heme Fe2+,alpha-ketoglutarate-dependent halogenase